jgi:hypothetical protein
MLKRIKNLIENPLFFNLYLYLSFTTLLITTGNLLTSVISCIAMGVITYNIYSLYGKKSSLNKEEIIKEDENIEKENNLFDSTDGKEALNEFIRTSFGLPENTKIHVINNLDINKSFFNNKQEEQPTRHQSSDRSFYLRNKLDILLGKIDANLEEIQKGYNMLLEMGQHIQAKVVYNKFLNKDFDPTLEEKISFIMNEECEVTSNLPMDNDLITLLFYHDIEVNGYESFFNNVKKEALDKEMYEVVAEISKIYETKEKKNG